MKKTLILAALMLFLLTACGEKQETAAQQTPSAETTQTQSTVAEAAQPEKTEEAETSAETQQETSQPEETQPEAEAETDPLLEQAMALIDSDVNELYDTIGLPIDVMYADSCLGEGEDGELYYDGFTVYTYRDTEDNETIYDVMAN